MRSARQKLVSLLAHGFGHVAGLAVRPNHPPVGQVNPVPLQQQDFRHAGGKLELQPDNQSQRRMLQALGIGLVKIGEQLPHLRIGDQAGRAFFWILRNMPAGV